MPLSHHPLSLNDANFVDDAGSLITTTFVDFRSADQRTPIHSLAKGCERQYALETSATLRIARPCTFRASGGGLIRDPNEGKATTTRVLAERIDDPDDLREARVRNREMMRAIELSGSMHKLTRRIISIKNTRSEGTTLTYGRNWWTFSTSILDYGQPPPQSWWESMDPKYDHVSWIRRPRGFARALGAMVAEQLGPQLDETQLTHKLNDGHDFVSNHSFQWLIHGPVVYVDDKYETLNTWPVRSTLPFAFMFVKDREPHIEQREYRFVVLAKEQPADAALLTISPNIRSTLHESPNPIRTADSLLTTSGIDHVASPDRGPRDKTVSQDVDRTAASAPLQDTVLNTGRPARFLDPPSGTTQATRPDMRSFPNQETHAGAMMEFHAWLSILEGVVGGADVSRRVEAASAAWHARKPIFDLLQEYEEPIQTVRIKDHVFVDICLTLTTPCKSEAHLVVGPNGCFALSIGHDGTDTLTHGEHWLGLGAVRGLQAAQLVRRRVDTM